MLTQFNKNIEEAKNALKNKHLMSKNEISYWNKQIKVNQQKKEKFKI
jgi:hypothetical protein